jgi:hypothetical protein
MARRCAPRPLLLIQGQDELAKGMLESFLHYG